MRKREKDLGLPRNTVLGCILADRLSTPAPTLDWSDSETWPPELGALLERQYEAGHRAGVLDEQQSHRDAAADAADLATVCAECSAPTPCADHPAPTADLGERIIGEHTSANNPWQNAWDYAGSASLHHDGNHSPLPDGVRLDPGYCEDCDRERADAPRDEPALADKVRALADEWESWGKGRTSPRIDAFRDAADQLRALLDRPNGGE
jgi:hypothetical protein